MELPTHDPWEADVVLADGGSAHVRPMRAGDESRVRDLYVRLSDRSRYLRFFAPLSAERSAALEHVSDLDDPRFTLVVEIGRDIVAVAEFDEIADGVAEVAFAVQDDQQGRGLGTILLEHLARIATTRGIRRFVANVLADNDAMHGVLSDAGFSLTSSRVDVGVTEAILDLAASASWLEAHIDREHSADALSIARVLAPSSIAVIGASRRPDAVGHAVFRNLLDGAFNGPVFPVNPKATSIADIPAYPSVLEIPDRVDLAIVTVPADVVLDVVGECGAKGVHGLVVISGGFAELGDHGTRQGDLTALARRNGMRVVGPNCVGIINTDPAVRMNATFAALVPTRGRIGFASQSGGVGIELLARAERLGLGVSTFVSLGNKADVSSNDLLQYWDRDPDTDVIVLYLESFGNPQKFARLARQISHRKPIIAMKSGRTPAGARGALSHTAALASPDVAVDELFRQAGVVRVDGLEELFDTAALLGYQPLPAGPRVAVVSNGGGPGILATDAAIAAGLDVPELSEGLQATLRELVPAGAAVRNPVDLVASAGAATFGAVLRELLDSPEIDAAIVIHVPTRGGRADEIESVIAAAARSGPKTVAVCLLARDEEHSALGRGSAAPVPTFAFPESAAAALGRAARLTAWRARPDGEVPQIDKVDCERARTLVDRRLALAPAGEWVDLPTTAEILGRFGVPVVASRYAATAQDAAAAAADLAVSVALKAAAPELVHKSDVGAVRLDLQTPDEVRAAFETMHEALGNRMGGAIVQPMVAPGVEVIVGITHDRLFGPLVLFGMGGFTAELLRDTALRILPVTDVDASEMVRSLRSSPLLFGYRNSPAVDVVALEDLLVHIGQLAEHIPEIVELDCNPVIVAAGGVTVVDAKMRIAPADGPPRSPLDLD